MVNIFVYFVNMKSLSRKKQPHSSLASSPLPELPFLLFISPPDTQHTVSSPLLPLSPSSPQPDELTPSISSDSCNTQGACNLPHQHPRDVSPHLHPHSFASALCQQLDHLMDTLTVLLLNLLVVLDFESSSSPGPCSHHYSVRTCGRRSYRLSSC